jgi:hypothetical protein
MAKAKVKTKATTKTPDPDNAPAADAAPQAKRVGDIAVGDVIDGWTVQAINGPEDVLVANGVERRTLTIRDLERAKQDTPKS